MALFLVAYITILSESLFQINQNLVQISSFSMLQNTYIYMYLHLAPSHYLCKSTHAVKVMAYTVLA